VEAAMAAAPGLSGWVVALAGTGINLALGVLYSWSVISKQIPETWGWSEADRALPYSVACLVFALMMVPAGRLQDKIGPRWVATAGGVLVGAGLMISSLFTSVSGFVFGFGLLAGAGIGLGYASATPPAVKWFPAKMTGLIAGIVVAGFGLASVYIAPLAQSLLNTYGVSRTLFIFGVSFLISVSLLSQLLRNPPSVLGVSKTQGPSRPLGFKVSVLPLDPGERELGPAAMLRTRQFYLLWFMYMFGAGAGLMIIGKLAKICQVQANIQAGFVLVALLAVGNASGRILAGFLSDKIGRTRTMLLVFLFQALLMFLLKFISDWPLFIILSILLGFNYGANLSVFPSITKDWFGLKNFGVNYGLVFTAWGAGGLLLPYVSGKVFDLTGRFDAAYAIAGTLLLFSACLTFLTRAPEGSSGSIRI